MTRAGGRTRARHAAVVQAVASSVKRLAGTDENGAGGQRLPEHLHALADLVEAGRGRLDETALEHAEQVIHRAGRRGALSGDHTVVALAGATGSGKSSLFNALTGLDLAHVGARRPTTSTSMASIWGADGADGLLDWLGIDRRHRIEHASVLSGPDELELAGLVLLDLPDHDSTVAAHVAEVDRLVDLVDMFVWVVDPQKYADAALHRRYLSRLERHREVMVVALNQADHLTAEEQVACRDDLARLLAAEGLADVPVLLTSVRTGQGVGDLRELLRRRLADRRLAAARLDADVLTAGAALAREVVPEHQARASSEVPKQSRARLTAALYEAAGGDVVTRAVDAAFRGASVRATGWPPTRWLRARRPDPLRRLHLPTIGEPARDREITAGASAVAAPTAARRGRVDRAVRELAGATGAALPEVWARAVADAATSRSADLPDALDHALTSTDIGTSRRPRWWTTCGMLAWLFFAVAVAGGAWLGLLALAAWLRLPDIPTPHVADTAITWPTALVAIGLVGSVIVALAGRAAATIGGRRRAAQARRRLTAAFASVGEDLVVGPVEDELSRYARAREAVDRLR